MATSASNRGKGTEKKVQDYLKLLEASHMTFTFNRVPDAHAAGGRFTPQAGDYQAFSTAPIALGESGFISRTGTTHINRNFIIEVKELKHDFRLPHASYSVDKVARVQKRVLAGTEAIVILFHSEAKVWRAVPFAVFTDRSTGGSWDLRAYPPVDYRTALSEFLGVLP